MNVQWVSLGMMLLSLVLKDPLNSITRMTRAYTINAKVFALHAMGQAIKNAWNVSTIAV